jgi:large subunit ribosomal protein L32e
MADEIRRLIRVRTQKGARFKRDGFGKKSQLSDSWRKPRGQHNKQREQKKAKGALPKPGFGSPLSVRGMHPSGFYEVLVYSADDLEGINAKTHAVRISAKVGNRKRSGIQEKALAAGLKVLNAREASARAETPPASLKAKKEIVQKKEKPKKVKPKPKKKEEEPREVKEEINESAKPAAKKKVKAEPAEKKPKTTKKPKVKKAKAEDSPEQKPGKSTKPKAESTKPKAESTKPKAESTKEKKEKPKTAQKTAASQKKKTASGVKDNE